MRRGTRLAALIGATALVGSSLGAQAFASDRHAHGSGGAEHGRHGPALDHIYVIMLENHSQSSVIGDVNAPYITHLAHTYAMADHYYGVTHPSMPNYIASIAGDNFGIQDDNDQNVVNFDRPNLVDQLERKHISWAAYMDTLPPNKLARFWPQDSTGADITLYAKKHNPFVLFDDIKNNPARMANVKDYSQMAADLNAPNPPKFVWISPNQCNDMHGSVNVAVPGHPETPCPYGTTKDDPNDASLKQKGDAYVKGAVQTIMGSQAWTRHSAIVIVTDENDYTGTNDETGGWETAEGCCDSPFVSAGDPRVSLTWPGGTYGGGLIPAIVVSPSGPRGYVDHTPYNHYSLLTTIEENWRLPYLGHAGDRANGVQAMWRSFVRR